MSPPLRLAILEADTPVPGAVRRHKNYTGVFTQLFAQALSPVPLSSEVAITSHHVVDDAVPRTPYPDLSSVDAVLISGSKHNAYDDDPWILELVEFTRKCLDTDGRVKVIGVCFGHQIVARALGMGTGVNGKGWEVSVTEVELTQVGREVFALEGGKMKIHQMHRDIVFDPPSSLPEGVEILATNPVCTNQGIYVPRRLITVQGHPEFNETIVSEILELRHGTGVLSDGDYESGMKRVGEGHDGVGIARAFLRFCGVGVGV